MVPKGKARHNLCCARTLNRAAALKDTTAMRCLKAGLGLGVVLAAWLAVAGLSAGGLVATATGASAQSLTPPAGQPRVTAPGGRRGKAALRHRKRHR